MAANDGEDNSSINNNEIPISKAEIDFAEKHQTPDDDHVEEAAAALASETSSAGRIQFHDSTVTTLHPRYLEERGRDVGKFPTIDEHLITEELGPGFAEESGDVGGHGYNDTTVDIIAVPCPGADPIQTWIYDHDSSTDSIFPARTASFMSRSIRNSRGSHASQHGPRQGSEHGSQHGSHHSINSSLRRSSPWVTYKLRDRVNGTARVFLYRHRCLTEGMTLKSLSNDLLEQVQKIREGKVRMSIFVLL